MFIINFTKLIKIWKNLKNRVISINKLEPKDDDDVEITIKGKFKREEEDVSKPPKWFKEFETKINQKITKLNKESKTKVPEWFTKWSENFENKINKRFNKIEKEIADMKNTPTMKKELALS